ncbi:MULTISPECIES: hypothetical protein [unclassified Pseudomonas]|nr:MULTISPECIES: hypothetical protein [unclassified Pseudomonas]
MNIGDTALKARRLPVLAMPAFALGVAVSMAMLRVTRRLLGQTASPK